jgi:hypothetical protein
VDINKTIEGAVEAFEPVYGKERPVALHEALRFSKRFDQALHGFGRNADVDIAEVGDPVLGFLQLFEEFPLSYVHKPSSFGAIRGFCDESVLY